MMNVSRIKLMRPHIFGNRAIIRFAANSQIQQAFNLLQTAIPKVYKNRGQIKQIIIPIDEQYGDIGENGYATVQWRAR
jgi:hypothetical protein